MNFLSSPVRASKSFPVYAKYYIFLWGERLIGSSYAILSLEVTLARRIAEDPITADGDPKTRMASIINHLTDHWGHLSMKLQQWRASILPLRRRSHQTQLHLEEYPQ
jgi:hypothetical protein